MFQSDIIKKVPIRYLKILFYSGRLFHSTILVVVRHVFPKFQNVTVWRATRSGFWPNMYSVLPDVVFHRNGHILPIAILFGIF